MLVIAPTELCKLAIQRKIINNCVPHLHQSCWMFDKVLEYSNLFWRVSDLLVIMATTDSSAQTKFARHHSIHGHHNTEKEHKNTTAMAARKFDGCTLYNKNHFLSLIALLSAASTQTSNMVPRYMVEHNLEH